MLPRTLTAVLLTIAANFLPAPCNAQEIVKIGIVMPMTGREQLPAALLNRRQLALKLWKC
jgi:hypothetical protein